MNVAVPVQKTTDVIIRGVTKVFGDPGRGRRARPRPDRPRAEGGRVLRRRGAVRLRQSSLLEIIAGISEPTEGEILFEGKPIRGRVPEGVGVVFQEDACFPWMDASANIAMGLHNMPIDGAEREQRVQGALEMMGLTEFRASYPTQLSGGMRQRVCIARTMVMAPRLILLDEPFGALDQQTRLLMGEEMLKLWRRVGTTIFLITHALDEAAMLADRIGVMSARPGGLLDIIETGWPVERMSEVVTRPEFGQITARLWRGLREERSRRSATIGRRHGHLTLLRILVVFAAVLVIEGLCRIGVIGRFTMQPPSEIIRDLYRAGEWEVQRRHRVNPDELGGRLRPVGDRRHLIGRRHPPPPDRA